MEYYLIFFIVFFAVLIIAGVAHSSRTSQEGDKQERINKSLKEVLSVGPPPKHMVFNDSALLLKSASKSNIVFKIEGTTVIVVILFFCISSNSNLG